MTDETNTPAPTLRAVLTGAVFGNLLACVGFMRGQAFHARAEQPT